MNGNRFGGVYGGGLDSRFGSSKVSDVKGNSGVVKSAPHMPKSPGNKDLNKNSGKMPTGININRDGTSWY